MTIKVNYGEMEQSAAEMKQCADAILATIDDLERKLLNLEWEGEDRTAYQEITDQMQADATAAGEIVGQIGAAVQTASDNYRETEMSNKASWG